MDTAASLVYDLLKITFTGRLYLRKRKKRKKSDEIMCRKYEKVSFNNLKKLDDKRKEKVLIFFLYIFCIKLD